MKKRKVYAGGVHHVFQRTIGRGLLFYSMKDILVFFTIYCAYADKRNVKILALCPMPDHIHLVLSVTGAKQLADFMHTATRLFAREWNIGHRRKGPLFQHPYGSSAKLGSKAVRTSLAYCNNNPVERKLTEKAEDYRWNFLAYYRNTHPFSEPLALTQASGRLRSAIKIVEACRDAGGYLRYQALDRWEKSLSDREWQQLADHIIGEWNVVDYEQAIAYYGSYESLLRAFRDNTGSEYEIPEERDPYSDAVYAACSRVLLAEGLVQDLREVPMMDHERKDACCRLLVRRTSARIKQVRKYLHLPLDMDGW